MAKIANGRDRFEVRVNRDCGSRPVWYIVDSELGIMQPKYYRLRRRAQAIADRWNADHALAEREARDIRTL